MGELRPFPEMVPDETGQTESRDCKDVFWAVFFILFAAFILGMSYMYGSEVIVFSTKEVQHTQYEVMRSTTLQPDGTLAEVDSPYHTNAVGVEKEKNIYPLASAGLAGASAAAFTSVAFVYFAKTAPTCVVYTSLLFSPIMLVISGFSMMATAAAASGDGGVVLAIVGAVSIAVGVCLGTCTFCCWKHLIPFMIALTEVVATVITEHVCVIFVGLIGAVLGTCWTMLCAFAFLGLYLENDAHLEDDNSFKQSPAMHYSLVFFAALSFTWGSEVARNICHVTYCGVFGRWYYGATARDFTILPSLKVALTSSFGSICFGSLIVASVQALEAVARSMRQQAQEEGNMVVCIVACLLECIIGCIGDIIEYFNEWAYVQCAVRGASFCEAGRITFALMTCANMSYIVRDLLLNSLVNLGAFLCCCVGALVGAATGYVMGGATPAAFGGVIGFFAGIVCGTAGVGIISSGVKTILASWADSPGPLSKTNPKIAALFNEKVSAGYDAEAKGQPAASSPLI